MTNEDKIKQLNTNGLAEIIMCPNEYDNNYIKRCGSRNSKNCIECTIKWLKQEYTNGFDYLFKEEE